MVKQLAGKLPTSTGVHPDQVAEYLSTQDDRPVDVPWYAVTRGKRTGVFAAWYVFVTFT